MKLAELKNNPFVLQVLKEGMEEGYFSPEFIDKSQKQLSDMSLRIASDYLSIIYADQIKKACEIVLGFINLGLLSLCNNNTDKAKEIIINEGIVYCFRAGWAKYNELKKISPSFFQEVNITTYALGINDTSDISAKHAKLLKDCYESVKLLEVYKTISALYAANKVIYHDDNEILQVELQKYLNSAIALLLIDSERKVFTTDIFLDFLDYLLSTEPKDVLIKFDECIKKLKATLTVTTRTYLEDIGVLTFSEFKKLIKQQTNIAVYVQEILELSVNVSNEINGDYDSDDDLDFGLDDDLDDLSFLFDR